MKNTAQPFSLMGVLNVTPDSFYDGGKYCSAASALQHAEQLVHDGAAIIDIGGASSRPGAVQLSVEEECRRVLPVVEQIASAGHVPLSVDTTSSVVARRVLEAGAAWINDISAGRQDPDMVKVVAEYQCTIVLMHSRGTPATMMQCTDYTSLLDDVVAELSDGVALFLKGGVAENRIVLDPGIGFAKTWQQNCELLASIEKIVALGFPVLLGTSRKSFIGEITGRKVQERLPGSLGSIAHAYLKGVTHFRVHDVGATADFLKVMTAIG